MKRFLTVLFAVIGTVFPASARDFVSQTSVVHTNFVDRWITNTAEVQLQVNRFVTEYHTNWITRAHTNVIDVFSTNLVLAYVTNRVHLTRTNFVNLFSTNLISKSITNHFQVDRIQTNFLQAYYTNLKTLNLTNWTTVVELKTNWVTKPVTNVVEIDLPANPAPATTSARIPSTIPEPLSLQASRGSRPTPNNQVEVQLKVSWTGSPSSPVQVQQWRIESQDGSILCFGQDPEFKRALPIGSYKVIVRAQRDPRSPLMAALGTLTVTSREVLLEQRPARSNSAT